MIKYYAYYNHGGFKNFYLGSQQDEDECRYFLPLLAIHEQSLIDNPDDSMRNEVERQKLLPKIVLLSNTTEEYNYPVDARILMSHSGYKLLYRQLNSNDYVLAIRDIEGPCDVYQRETKFNVMFIGDNPNDRKKLDILSEYARCNLSEFESFLISIFEKDSKEKGLKVYLRKLNEEVNRVVSLNFPVSFDETLNKSVRMVVIPCGMTMSNLSNEQNVLKNSIAICYSTDGTLIYKASRQYQDNFDDFRRPIHQEVKSNYPNTNEDYSNEKYYFLREEIKKIWDYIHHELEEKVFHLKNKE